MTDAETIGKRLKRRIDLDWEAMLGHVRRLEQRIDDLESQVIE